MLRLGTLGFGGPVALAGYMHRDLVDERKWITDADYTGRPGAGAAGAWAAGRAARHLSRLCALPHRRGDLGRHCILVIPSFPMVVALGWAYVRFGGLTWMQSVF
ncbi:chromate transporter [Cupriavidus basilensis]